MRLNLLATRGQVGIEFVLVVAVVVSIVVGVLLPLFGESEVSTAIAAARIGVLQETSRNGSLFLSSIDYSFSGRNVTLSPSVYFFGTKVSNSDGLKLSALRKIASTFSPSKLPDNPGACVPALYYAYCVS